MLVDLILKAPKQVKKWQAVFMVGFISSSARECSHSYSPSRNGALFPKVRLRRWPDLILPPSKLGSYGPVLLLFLFLLGLAVEHHSPRLHVELDEMKDRIAALFLF